jgi:hypothetical protein
VRCDLRYLRTFCTCLPTRPLYLKPPQEQRRQERRQRPLTPKQQVTCDEWLVSRAILNVTCRRTARIGGSGGCARSCVRARRLRLQRLLLRRNLQSMALGGLRKEGGFSDFAEFAPKSCTFWLCQRVQFTRQIAASHV